MYTCVKRKTYVITAQHHGIFEYNSIMPIGHGSVIKAPNGEDWIMYHAWKWHQVGQQPPGRVLCLDKIHWDVNVGWPYIGVPSSKPTLAPNVFTTTIFS